MSVPPSGEQYEISHEGQRATVVEVGGGVRTYQHNGRPVLDPYPLSAMCDGAHGAPLIPWPNRLADGRYRFDGEEYQLAITEPKTHNAIHGLLRWRNWELQEREPARVRVGTRLHPMQGWPFLLDASIDYSLGPEGLRVQTRVTNRGESDAPVAAGQHPYLSPGPGHVDECSLELAAATRILTDPERQLPVGEEPVAGSDFDFRRARKIGGQRIDHPFTDLRRDEQGRAWVRLAGPDRRTVEMWIDSAYPIVEIYTGDTLAPARRRLGLGAEPMSAPPNALASGRGVVRLAPGATWTGSWGVRLV